ncbi:hypothetical protein HAX54_035861, partial [Datura stramonium]|nr:hypothetical protein [Datura stramonium]
MENAGEDLKVEHASVLTKVSKYVGAREGCYGAVIALSHALNVTSCLHLKTRRGTVDPRHRSHRICLSCELRFHLNISQLRAATG